MKRETNQFNLVILFCSNNQYHIDKKKKKTVCAEVSILWAFPRVYSFKKRSFPKTSDVKFMQENKDGTNIGSLLDYIKVRLNRSEVYLTSNFLCMLYWFTVRITAMCAVKLKTLSMRWSHKFQLLNTRRNSTLVMAVIIVAKNWLRWYKESIHAPGRQFDQTCFCLFCHEGFLGCK